MTSAPDREELAAWLRLLATPGLGRDAIRSLLTIFGSPQAVLAATPAELSDIGNASLLKALETPAHDVSAQVEAILQWLSAPEAHSRHVLMVGDPRYSPLLLESADPPLMLYAQGRIELLGAEAIAVVGSRNPTPQGFENARAFASHLSRSGLTIVSGLALGIDGAAHEGALEGRGSTIAVVGTGLDRVYPRRHLDLARRIAQQGLIVSEYPLGTPPLPAHFPQRNRIIAGLARGTLVVEAAQPSGSLITARMAIESSRDVFAIPGSIHSPQSRGCNTLIKQGAKLVDRAEDILEELKFRPSPLSTPGQPSEAADTAAIDPLLDALGYEPMSLDELVARTGRTPHDLSGRLLDLELQGQVTRMPGQLFQRTVRA